jgi:AcrR family transcriptional regulator
MPRDADATRRRILEAATAEFAAHGIAGARVDRIAASAGANKSLIYAYFGSKDGLFDAVFDAAVVATVDEIPIDADDLPGYAARLYDHRLERPDLLRLAHWDRLERDGVGIENDTVQGALASKVKALARAQKAGKVSSAASRSPARVHRRPQSDRARPRAGQPRRRRPPQADRLRRRSADR